MGTATAADELVDEAAPPAEGARAGIVSGELYFSRFSAPRRKGTRLVCGADEDAVTMAVEAAEGALQTWLGSPETIDGLFVALDHGPELADTNAQAVREALGLSSKARVVTFSNELGGLDALQGALAAVGVGSLSAVLVIAAEQAADEGDLRNAGAAAMIVQGVEELDSGISIQEQTRASAFTHTHWFDSELEPQEPDFRFFSHRYLMLGDAVIANLREQEAASVDALVFAGGTPADHRRVRSDYHAAFGAARDPSRVEVADFGVASPLIALLMAARAHSGATVGLFAHGSGQMVFVEARLPRSVDSRFGSREQPQETEAPAPISKSGPALSLPAESPFFHRDWGETLRLEAAKCEGCGHIVYPHSMRAICSKCGGTDLRTYRLPRRGVVYSFIDNRFNPAGFPDHVVSVLGELEDGFRHWAPMPPETDAGDVAIGQAVELHLRRFTSRHGLPVYALKFMLAPKFSSGSESKGSD